jgi:hypothetical protein
MAGSRGGGGVAAGAGRDRDHLPLSAPGARPLGLDFGVGRARRRGVECWPVGEA